MHFEFDLLFLVSCSWLIGCKLLETYLSLSESYLDLVC